MYDTSYNETLHSSYIFVPLSPLVILISQLCQVKFSIWSAAPSLRRALAGTRPGLIAPSAHELLGLYHTKRWLPTAIYRLIMPICNYIGTLFVKPNVRPKQKFTRQATTPPSRPGEVEPSDWFSLFSVMQLQKEASSAEYVDQPYTPT